MSVDVRDNEECTGDNTNSGVIEQGHGCTDGALNDFARRSIEGVSGR
jgi:hypothetical protein